MVRGFFHAVGKGITLEKFKFVVYLGAPIAAVVLYSQPAVHETALKSSRYIVYTNPPVPVFKRGGKGEAKRKEEAGDEGVAAGAGGGGGGGGAVGEGR